MITMHTVKKMEIFVRRNMINVGNNVLKNLRKNRLAFSQKFVIVKNGQLCES